MFEFVTGVMNVQYWYAFRFNFVVAHYYGAIVFVASLVLHVALKTPVILRAYRERGVLKPLRDDLARTRPEPADEHGGLVAPSPAEPTISRRGVFALVGAGSLTLLLANAGETIGGPLRRLSLFAPRRQVIGSGPNDFQVNKTAPAAGITASMTGPDYRLALRHDGREVLLSRDELLAIDQHTARLPIACVEGWTTTQEWTGVRLADLARMAGAPGAASALVRSLQPRGVLSRASLNAGQLGHPDALLALKVNGADLSPDHGYPARIIVPAPAGRAQHEVGRGDRVRMRARYGASPLHLLAHLILLPLVAFALLQIAERGDAPRILIWLALSAVVHDLLLLPFYGLLDRVEQRAAGRAVNYVRVPTLLSGLLLLVFFPVISGKGGGAFHGVSGLDYDGYLARWLLITAALFALSGAAYLVRGRRS